MKRIFERSGNIIANRQKKLEESEKMYVELKKDPPVEPEAVTDEERI